MQNFTQVSEVTISYKSKVKPSDRPSIKQSSDAIESLRKFSAMAENIEYKEVFLLMALNHSHKALSITKISEGGTAGTVVDTKQIFQSLILQNATAFVLCHNHPSGNERPSDADISITKKIKEAAKLFDMTLLDHIILTPESHTSMIDECII